MKTKFIRVCCDSFITTIQEIPLLNEGYSKNETIDLNSRLLVSSLSGLLAYSEPEASKALAKLAGIDVDRLNHSGQK